MLFPVLLILIICGTTLTSETENNLKKNAKAPALNHEKNETKVSPVSERVPIISDAALTLPDETQPDLFSSDKEFGKTKKKPVVPRKGVKYNNISHESGIHALKNAHNKGNDTLLNSSSTDVKNLNVTEAPKKPLILLYDALSEAEHTMTNGHSKTSISSSTKTISNQISSPLNDKETITHMKNSIGHPGMIMPLVITILVVPVFALLAYMVLRKGQEAWRNRHYKRMDFLLDGMYND